MSISHHNVFSIVVSGSFRRYYPQVLEKIAEFEAIGFQVTSPKKSKIVNPDAEFVLLESDVDADPKVIEQGHLDAIYNSDALYIVNPAGYVGKTTMMEIGWALAFSKPVIFQEECEEKLFTAFGKVIPAASGVRELLEDREKILFNTISHRTPVELLQKYIHKVVVKRGFDKETPRDILLLMMEEVGELAKAIRKFSGLKVDSKKASTRGNLEEELADVFIYLLDLANSCNVDLFLALHQKEMENEKRSWSAQK